MKYEVDSYILEYNEKTNQYFICFKDSVNNECRLEIEKEVFDIYMKSKKEYKRIQNQHSRHEEHSEQTEINLYKRSTAIKVSLEDIVIQRLRNNELRKLVKEIPEPHNRRLEMYFFEDMTIKEIALKEKRNERTIRYSIAKGIKEISKKIKKIF